MPDSQEIRDITIIGGGPTGIFALFYAGMRGATARLVDALPELGGQLTALYPEKYIFDVAGFPKVLAKDLVRSLAEQAAQFKQPVHLLHKVLGLEEHDGRFTLVTDKEPRWAGVDPFNKWIDRNSDDNVKETAKVQSLAEHSRI